MAQMTIHIDTDYGFVEVESAKSKEESYIDILDHLMDINEPNVQKWVEQQMTVEGVEARLKHVRSIDWIMWGGEQNE